MKILIYILTIINFSCGNFTLKSSNLPISEKKKTYKEEISRIKTFAETNGYNQKTAFMVDYSIHSGRNRFFVINLETNTISRSALVCHGSCKGDDRNDNDIATNFSNKSGSLCSTLGMSLISYRAYSSWGGNYKYWLEGLEKSNKNMRSRVVVLHSWEGVADEETYPKPLAMSWGCPTVSIGFLDTLDKILKKETKVLLYSFE
jgi:hypothetical protein